MFIIPKELLDMNAGDFLDRHECELDEILMGSKRVGELRRTIEVRLEPPQEGRFNSPPKKSVKKVIIKKKQ